MRHCIHLRSLVLCAVSLLLSGCVPALIARVSLDSKIETLERGSLVGSMGCIDLPGYGNHHLDFRSKDRQIRGWIVFLGDAGDIRSQLDWDEPNWKGIAFNLALPPGVYEFNNLAFGTLALGFAGPFDISVPFRIKRDEITYIGEIKCHYTLRSEIYPKRLRTVDPYLVISDEAVRDIPVLRKKFPDLEGHSLRIEVPSTNPSPSPFIRTSPTSHDLHR